MDYEGEPTERERGGSWLTTAIDLTQNTMLLLSAGRQAWRLACLILHFLQH